MVSPVQSVVKDIRTILNPVLRYPRKSHSLGFCSYSTAPCATCSFLASIIFALYQFWDSNPTNLPCTMVQSTRSDPYLGYPRFSYIPDGLIAHIAPAPEQLCSKCSTLHFANYSTTNTFVGEALPEQPSPVNDIGETTHKTYLGTYQELTPKALAYGFCQLVIGVLVHKNTELQQQAQTRNETSICSDRIILQPCERY